MNGLAPGLLDTNLTHVASSNPKDQKSTLARFLKIRMGAPVDMAGVPVFPEPSVTSNVMGLILVVDCGISV